MIIELRKKLKSKLARNIILWTILIVLILGLGSSVFLRVFKLEGKLGGGGFATVNGNDISVANFRMKMQENEQRIQMIRRYFGAEADKLLKQMEIASDPRNMALNTVINQELFDEMADKLSISLSSDYIDKKFMDINFLQSEFGLIDFDKLIDPATGIVDKQGLSMYLRMIGLTGSMFEDMLLKAMKRELLTQIAANSFYIPEFEIRQEYVQKYLAKKYSMLRFDFNSFMQKVKANPVSKEELKRFYDEQNAKSKRYMVPEKRAGIAYSFDANSYGITIREDEVARYYDDNKMSLFVKEPAKVQVRRILFSDQAKALEIKEKLAKSAANTLNNGGEFEKLAKEYSQDKDAAKSGGLIPAFSRGSKDAEFEKAAFTLKNNGDISDVIKTKDGYEILKRENRQETVFKPMVEVTGQIKDKLIKKKFKEVFSSDMGKLMARYSFDENKFNELIKKAVKTENIEAAIAGEDNISSALFRSRDGIPAYFVEEDKCVIVKPTSIQDKHMPALEAIEATVAGDYYEKKASELLNSVIKKVVIEGKKSALSQIEKTYNDKYQIEYADTGFIKEENIDKNNSLRSRGFPVDKIFDLDAVGSTNYYRNSLETSDGFVAKLDEIEKFDDKQYAKKRAELKKELIMGKKMNQLEEIIAFLRKKATIRVNK